MTGKQSSASSSESLFSATTSAVQSVCESIVSTIRTSVDTVIPPSSRAAATSRAKTFAQEKPLVASFVLSHLVFSGIPLLLFTLQAVSILLFSLATALLIGTLCALAFTAVCVGLATLFVAPVLLVTGFLGFGAWCWAWMGWYILRWIGVLESGGSLTMGAGERKARSANEEGKGIRAEQTDGPVVDGKGHTTA